MFLRADGGLACLPPALVLVVVVVMRGMPVPVVGVINMVAVADRVVPAARRVGVAVVGVGEVRQRVLVVVPLVDRVGVALVDVVGVTLVRHTGMAAVGPMLVTMPSMDLVRGGGHCSPVVTSCGSSVL